MGGGRPAEEWGGGIGELGGHVLLLSHVALGTVVGERQAGEENTTHRELWAWGLGEQDGCFFPRLYQREKIKCREIDLPLTIRLVAHTHTLCVLQSVCSSNPLCVPQRERKRCIHAYSLYLCMHTMSYHTDKQIIHISSQMH